MMWLASIAMLGPPSGGCELEVVGIPVPALSHHTLVTDGARIPLARRMSLRLGRSATVLRVTGPRYTGRLQVPARTCAPGVVLRLEAEPRPARVKFPCPPAGLTVECPGCTGPAGETMFLAEDFPPMAMSSFSARVQLVFRAPGFRRKTQVVQLHPGPNEVHVKLEPLE